MRGIARGLVTVVVVAVVGGCGGTAEQVAGPEGSLSPSTAPLSTAGSPPDAASIPPSPVDRATAQPTEAPPASRPPNTSAVAEDELRITFVTGGGCYDRAEPVGCGEQAAGPVADPALRASIVLDAPRLAAVPDGDTGCGGEFVDGVSVRAVVEAELAELAPIWTICLSNVDDDDPTGRALWRLYEQGRGG